MLVYECQKEEHYDRGKKKTLVRFLPLLVFIISAFNVYIMRHVSGKKTHASVCIILFTDVHVYTPGIIWGNIRLRDHKHNTLYYNNM